MVVPEEEYGRFTNRMEEVIVVWHCTACGLEIAQ